MDWAGLQRRWAWVALCATLLPPLPLALAADTPPAPCACGVCERRPSAGNGTRLCVHLLPPARQPWPPCARLPAMSAQGSSRSASVPRCSTAESVCRSQVAGMSGECATANSNSPTGSERAAWAGNKAGSVSGWCVAERPHSDPTPWGSHRGRRCPARAKQTGPRSGAAAMSRRRPASRCRQSRRQG